MGLLINFQVIRRETDRKREKREYVRERQLHSLLYMHGNRQQQMDNLRVDRFQLDVWHAFFFYFLVAAKQMRFECSPLEAKFSA